MLRAESTADLEGLEVLRAESTADLEGLEDTWAAPAADLEGLEVQGLNVRGANSVLDQQHVTPWDILAKQD